MSTPTPAPPPAGRGSKLMTAGLVVVLAAAAGGYYLYERSKSTPPPVDEFLALKDFFRRLAGGGTLAAGYADADGDLVADPPADGKFRPVEVIGFSVVGTGDEERRKRDEAEWQGVAAALAKATGKKVEYRGDLGSADEQIEALRAGRLQVTAFNTGAVPRAVATAGFVPLFAPADAAGKFGYQALVLVKADSPARGLADLKGKKLAFVGLSSNSGARVPMHALKEKAGLLPGRDYTYRISGDHYGALADLLDGNADAACVASDQVERAFNGTVKLRGRTDAPKREQVRAVYTSETFPPLCFGVAHDLPPDLRAKATAALRDYQFPPGAAFAKFAPVNYKADFQYVRDVDAALAKLADVP